MFVIVLNRKLTGIWVSVSDYLEREQMNKAKNNNIQYAYWHQITVSISILYKKPAQGSQLMGRVK